MSYYKYFKIFFAVLLVINVDNNIAMNEKRKYHLLYRLLQSKCMQSVVWQQWQPKDDSHSSEIVHQFLLKQHYFVNPQIDEVSF